VVLAVAGGGQIAPRRPPPDSRPSLPGRPLVGPL